MGHSGPRIVFGAGFETEYRRCSILFTSSEIKVPMTAISNIIQSPLFSKKKKRLTKNEIRALDDAVRRIIETPEIGQLKSGDLSGVRVYKFRSLKTMTLLAYEISGDTLFLYTFGSHENFYRALKKYVQY